MQGGRVKRKIILEGEEIEWGEAVTEVESDKQIFPKTKNVEPLIKRTKQSILPVLSCLEWQAYVLLKELVWESVDMAWCAREVSMWEAGDIPVPASSGQQSKGGQGESDPTQPVMGGQGFLTSTLKVKKRN